MFSVNPFRFLRGNSQPSLFCIIAFGLGILPLPGHAYTLNFDGLADGVAVTDQYAAQGVNFAGAYAAVSAADGGSLNELDFPPSSGNTVVTNYLIDGSPAAQTISILFGTPVQQVSGYFVYGDTDIASSNGSQLFISAYSFNNMLLSQVALSENLGAPAYLSLTGQGFISRIELKGEPDSQFTLDDLSGIPLGGGDTGNGGGALPEPETLFLLAAGGLAAWLNSRKA